MHFFSSFILANTGQLHAKISQLSDRVRQLEDVLRDNCSPEHPLLSPELLQMKTIQEFYGVPPSASTSQADSSHRDGENLHQAVNTLSLSNSNEHSKPYTVDVSLPRGALCCSGLTRIRITVALQVLPMSRQTSFN